MIYRAMEPQEFLRSQEHLNINIGVLNTLVAARKFLVHRPQCAGRPCRRPRQGAAPDLSRRALRSGVHPDQGLRVVDENRCGFTPFRATTSSRSTTCSPACTCSHVSLGLLILGRHGPRTAQPSTSGECSWSNPGATYWHMVDLLWIVIFALLYVDEVSPMTTDRCPDNHLRLDRLVRDHHRLVVAGARPIPAELLRWPACRLPSPSLSWDSSRGA